MSFTHFPKETVKFYEELVTNNNKEWFEANRKIYENFVTTPSKAFVEELGARLKTLVPDIIYSPKINGSIFKIFKDARYAKGAPLKTHLGIFFWEGGARLESSGFYFSLNPPFYTCGAGVAMFDKETLAAYRNIMLDKKKFAAFIKIVEAAEKEGFRIEGEKRKSLPRGIKAEGRQAEFLMYNSIYLHDDTPVNADFYADTFIDEVFDVFKKMVPFHNWMAELIKQAQSVKIKTDF